MTGFSALAVADDGDENETRWSGVSRILGPRWLQLPVLTVGLLGVQVLWSVEMSQGEFSNALRKQRLKGAKHHRISLDWGSQNH